MLSFKCDIDEVIALRLTTLTEVVQQVNGKLVDTSVESAGSQAVAYEKLMSNYEALGRKLDEFKITAAHAPASTAAQLARLSTGERAHSPLTQSTHLRIGL